MEETRHPLARPTHPPRRPLPYRRVMCRVTPYTSPRVGAKPSSAPAADPLVRNLIGVIRKPPVVGILVTIGLGGQVEDQRVRTAQVLQAVPNTNGDHHEGR